MTHKNERCTAYALFGAFIAALGGFLFGFHTAVVSGALIPLSLEFNLSLWDQSFLVSSILLGAVAGSSLGGFASDYFGRKNTLFLAALILLIGGTGAVYAPSYFFLVGSRLLGGIAIGLFAIVSPLYLAEIAPAPSRGAFVASYQLAIVFGVFVAYLVNWAFSEGWRQMFAIGLIPIGVQMLGMLALCETPSFLLSKGKKEKAVRAFLSLRKDRAWEHEVEDSKPVTPAKTHISRLLFDPVLRKILFLGLAISIFQQITGINTVTYFTPKILTVVGGGVNQGLLVTVWIGIANIIATLISVVLMDRVGRRLLMLISIVGSLLSLCVLGWGLSCGCALTVTLVALIAYVTFFSIGLGPVTWVLISEIYPLSMRGKGMSIAVFANWLFNYIVTFSFLHLVNWCGLSWSFYIYAAIGVLAFLFMKKCLPETKGKSLEEIEQSFLKK